MPKSKEALNRRKNRLLDFGDRLLRGLTGGKSLTGGLISQSVATVSETTYQRNLQANPFAKLSPSPMLVRARVKGLTLRGLS